MSEYRRAFGVPTQERRRSPTPAYDAVVPPVTPNRQRLLAHLHELVDALDRRVPHLEREGEVRIAGEAAALKQKALDLIAELEGQAAG
jgi:hypothetical protein